MSERSLGYALLDNVIGFDDDYRTAGERLGSAIKDNPRAVAKSVVDGVTGSIGDFATRVREEGPASALTGSLQDYSESILGAGLNLSGGTQGYMDRGMTQAEARDAQLGDAMLVSELIPLVGGAGLAARSAKAVVPEAPFDPSRRDFMAKGAAAAGVAAIMPEELLKQAGKVLSKAPKGSLGSVLGNLENINVLSNDLYRKIEELGKKIGDKATERTLRSNPRLKNILIDEETMKEVSETRPIVEDIDILSDQLDKGEFQRGVLVRETLEDLTPEKIANATSSEIEEFLHHVMSSPTTIMESVLEPSDSVEFLNFEGLLKEAQRRGMHEEIVDGLNTKDHGMGAVAYPTTRTLYQEFLGEYKGEKFAEGGEVMNRMQQGIGSIPRQTMIRDQPHMLAYITPAEAMLLKQNGGSGLASHGGVPEFGAIGDFFGAMKDDFMIGTGMKDDPGPTPRDDMSGLPSAYERRTQQRKAREQDAIDNYYLYKEDDKPQPVFAQPMYQAPAPMPASFAPPTMAPINSGQPTVPVNTDDPVFVGRPVPPSDVISRPALPQRPANKAYTFQELLGMYQNPYA